MSAPTPPRSRSDAPTSAGLGPRGGAPGYDRRLHAQAGFTLVELIVTVSILAVLSGVVVLSASGFGDGEEASCDSDLHAVQVAANAYRARNGHFAADLTELRQAGLLDELPGPPDPGDTSFSVGSYTVTYDPTTGDVDADCGTDATAESPWTPTTQHIPPGGNPPTEWRLTSWCTPKADWDNGHRKWRVTNPEPTNVTATVRNVSTGDEIDLDVPPGTVFFSLGAENGRANTTKLIVDGAQKDVKASQNLICLELSGSAACDSATGNTTVTWTATNHNGAETGGEGAPATIINADPASLSFTPNELGGDGATSVASQTVTGPAIQQDLTASYTADVGVLNSGAEATVTLPPCSGS